MAAALCIILPMSATVMDKPIGVAWVSSQPEFGDHKGVRALVWSYQSARLRVGRRKERFAACALDAQARRADADYSTSAPFGRFSRCERREARNESTRPDCTSQALIQAFANRQRYHSLAIVQLPSSV